MHKVRRITIRIQVHSSCRSTQAREAVAPLERSDLNAALHWYPGGHAVTGGPLESGPGGYCSAMHECSTAGTLCVADTAARRSTCKGTAPPPPLQMEDYPLVRKGSFWVYGSFVVIQMQRLHDDLCCSVRVMERASSGLVGGSQWHGKSLVYLVCVLECMVIPDFWDGVEVHC